MSKWACWGEMTTPSFRSGLSYNHLQLLGTVVKSRSRSEKRAMIRRFRDDVLPMMGKELQPVVGALYPLSATSDADRRMEAGGVFGKIVLDDFHG